MNEQAELEKRLAEIEEEMKVYEFAINQMKFEAIGILEQLSTFDNKYVQIAYQKSKEWDTLEPFSG